MVVAAPAIEIDKTERALAARARRGDTRAFASLVERHMRRTYYAALGLVGSEEDAMDLSQEAFARAFRARRSLDPDRPFYAWLYTILRNLCFNFQRDRRARRQKLDAASDWLADDAAARATEQSPEQQALLSETRCQLMRALEKLPDREREILVLKEFEELRYREIAELLGIPIGTVMSRLYSARKKLAQAWEEGG